MGNNKLQKKELEKKEKEKEINDRKKEKITEKLLENKEKEKEKQIDNSKNEKLTKKQQAIDNLFKPNAEGLSEWISKYEIDKIKFNLVIIKTYYLNKIKSSMKN